MFAGLSHAWPWNPGVLAFLVVLSLLYILGVRNAKNGLSGDESVKTRHILLFFSAIVIAAILLLTPIDTIAHTQLFSIHMTQAVILTTLCAPLVLFGSPARVLRPLTTWPVMGAIIRVLTRPLVASIIFNLVFLLWHTPRIFHIALENTAVYHVEMISIFVAALLNWYPLIGSVRELRTMSYPMQILYAFFDGQPVDILAFVLVFSGVTVYPYYAIPPQLNITSFADQAVGGALLLIPGLIDLVVMSPLFFRWLAQIEHQTKLRDQRRQALLEMEEEEYEVDDVEETPQPGYQQ